MASLKREAQSVLSAARDGIAWIAIWKNGKSWFCHPFWPDYQEDTQTFTFEDSEQDMLDNVLRVDPRAVFVNSYYCNLGDCEEMTRESLAKALRWQYESGSSKLSEVKGKEAKA